MKNCYQIIAIILVVPAIIFLLENNLDFSSIFFAVASSISSVGQQEKHRFHLTLQITILIIAIFLIGFTIVNDIIS